MWKINLSPFPGTRRERGGDIALCCPASRKPGVVEEEIRGLPRTEQERLLRTLLEELDGPSDPDADRAWLDEVQRRSAEFDAGQIQAIPADEVFARVRARLKQ